jgi:hypothetical protein
VKPNFFDNLASEASKWFSSHLSSVLRFVSTAIVTGSLGAIGFLISHYRPEGLLKSGGSWLDWVFATVGLFAGFTTSKLLEISYFKKDISDEVKSKLVEYRNELSRIQQSVSERLANDCLIAGVQGHTQGFEILSAYLHKQLSEITNAYDKVRMEEYLHLLTLSVERVTVGMFATSLVSPAGFLENKQVMQYLEKTHKAANKISKKHNSKLPWSKCGFEFARVFICDRGAWNRADVATQQIIEAHHKAGIGIGYCCKDTLATQECRDFVYFVSEYNNEQLWVIDVGTVSLNGQKQPNEDTIVSLRFHLCAEFIRSHWRGIVDKIIDNTNWENET